MFREPIGKSTLIPLILRIALGVIFIYHGFDKVSGPNNNLGTAWAVELWNTQNSPPPGVTAKLDAIKPKKKENGESTSDKEYKEKLALYEEWEAKLRAEYSRTNLEVPATLGHASTQLAVAWGELAGGVAMLLGFMTRLAALGLIVIQAGAVYTVTAFRGFSVTEGGYEYNLALLAMCAAVFLTGGGIISLDRILRRRR
jgi:uncharacterized membrane protein YphA (DoxX/SURF4 family)